jgi:hypothetical protein
VQWIIVSQDANERRADPISVLGLGPVQAKQDKGDIVADLGWS